MEYTLSYGCVWFEAENVEAVRCGAVPPKFFTRAVATTVNSMAYGVPCVHYTSYVTGCVPRHRTFAGYIDRKCMVRIDRWCG